MCLKFSGYLLGLTGSYRYSFVLAGIYLTFHISLVSLLTFLLSFLTIRHLFHLTSNIDIKVKNRKLPEVMPYHLCKVYTINSLLINFPPVAKVIWRSGTYFVHYRTIKLFLKCLFYICID